jgi:hypothetical protein
MSTSPATHGRARVEVAQVALQNHRADGVAERRGENRRRPKQRIGTSRDIDADERDDSHQTDHETHQPEPSGTFARIEAQRQQRDEERCRRDDDRGEGRRDALLTDGDQRKRDGDLNEGERGEPSASTAQGPEDARTPGGRNRTAAPSKSLAPALRLGWIVCPPELVETIAEEKRLDDRGSPGLEQLPLASLIESGRYDRHLRRMRAVFACGRGEDSIERGISAVRDLLSGDEVRPAGRSNRRTTDHDRP